MFELFNPGGELRITTGNLPHWFQSGVTYFVTFRTEDSLPHDVADLWYRKRNDWLRRRGIEPSAKGWHAQLEQLPPEQRDKYHQEFSQDYLALLDKGYGESVLRRSELAQVVADGLKHFDGERYEVGDFVVMPNHVHLLVGLSGDTDIEQQCYSWKKFTAMQINRKLGRSGRFWQEESFDHLVRSPESFERFREYIAHNGPSAGLHPDDYLHYVSVICTK